MIDAGIEFGPGTVYGSALIKVGKTQQNLGQTERNFVTGAYRGFVQPLRKFLDEDMKTITVFIFDLVYMKFNFIIDILEGKKNPRKQKTRSWCCKESFEKS